MAGEDQKGKIMKTRTKLTLLGAAICCTSVGALAVATYAWFDTASDVRVSPIGVHLKSDIPDLRLDFYPTVGESTFHHYTGGENDPEVSGNVYAYSSSLGETFVEQSANGSFASATPENKIMRFGVALHSDSYVGENDLEFYGYFGGNTSNSEDQKLSRVLRCAVVEKTDATFATTKNDGQKWVMVYSKNDPRYSKYLASADAQEPTSISQDIPLLDYTNAIGLGKIGNETILDRYFLFTVWAEGTTPDDMTIAKNGNGYLTIGFRAD